MNSLDRLDDIRFVQQQYKTKDNLAVRIRTHELYSEVKGDFTGWVLNKIDWQGDEIVVDVGCGAGTYVKPTQERASQYIAGDLSFGMLRGLKVEDLTRINLDAQWLPLASNSVDVLLANHMLYHVPDRDQAVREFARVLRPGGYLLAATNGEKHMDELTTLRYGAFAALGLDLPQQAGETAALPAGAGASEANQFTLENGAHYLTRHFAQVECHLLPGALVFPEPQPVLDYIASARERVEGTLPEDIPWEALVATLRQILEAHIERYGSFRVSKIAGVFVCSNG